MKVVHKEGGWRIIKNEVTGQYKIQSRFLFFFWEDRHFLFRMRSNVFESEAEAREILRGWIRGDEKERGWK